MSAYDLICNTVCPTIRDTSCGCCVASSPVPYMREQVDAILDAFATAYARTYSSSAPAIARVMARCGESLRGSGVRQDGRGEAKAQPSAGESAGDVERGHIYWSGAGAGGIIAAIDASEMPDTYGAAFDETRAFVFGGWDGVSPLSSVNVLDTTKL